LSFIFLRVKNVVSKVVEIGVAFYPVVCNLPLAKLDIEVTNGALTRDKVDSWREADKRMQECNHSDCKEYSRNPNQKLPLLFSEVVDDVDEAGVDCGEPGF
jgi:hypothetical protein